MQFKEFIFDLKMQLMAAVLAFISLSVIFASPFLDTQPSLNPTSKFINVSLENVVEHLKNFERIGDEHGSSRSVVNGHQASVQYIVNSLKSLESLQVDVQDVYIPVQVDKSAPAMEIIESDGNHFVFQPRLDIATATGSGSSFLKKAKVHLVTSCSSVLEFSNEKTWVAVIDFDYTACHPCSRLLHAIDAGAAGAIFLQRPGNQQGYPFPLPPGPGRCGRSKQNRESMGKIGIMSLGDSAAFTFLTKMAHSGSLFRINFKIESVYKDIVSQNIIATSKAGSNTSIAIFAAHLDSVPAGVGVNDDGSGSAATLELARAFDASILSKKTVSKLQFAWWTGEEIGLLGSQYYVKNLAPEQLKAYKVNIDTDMIASPNFVRGVWSGQELAEPLKSRADKISKLIKGWFHSRDLPTFDFNFNGRSDFQSFIDAGVVAGGVITGEDEIKSPESEKLFGGIASMVLDPCYHQDCDRLETLSGNGMVILEQNVKVLGYTLDFLSSNPDLAGWLDK